MKIEQFIVSEKNSDDVSEKIAFHMLEYLDNRPTGNFILMDMLREHRVFDKDGNINAFCFPLTTSEKLIDLLENVENNTLCFKTKAICFCLTNFLSEVCDDREF